MDKKDQEKMWDNLEALKSCSQALFFVACIGTLTAAIAVPLRFFVIERRVSELSDRNHANKEAELRGQLEKAQHDVAQARDDAMQAKTEASQAKATADHANTKVSRFEVRLPTAETKERVLESLRAWTSKHPGVPLGFTGCGNDRKSMQHVIELTLGLLDAANIGKGKRIIAGMAGGIPHGAIIKCEANQETAAAELASALQPLIRNITVQSGKGTPLTLTLNGQPAFEEGGAFTLE